jgi:magnesium chelatase family protein
MLSILKSFGLVGISGYPLGIEVDINNGLPSYEIVGLGDTAVKESRERVRSAIKNSGLNYPMERITVNLAPAGKKKEGAMYDLAIAAGILSASGQLDSGKISSFALFGELSLDGSIREVNGILPLLICARECGCKDIILPRGNAVEASYIQGLNIYALKSLSEFVQFINGSLPVEKIQNSVWDSSCVSFTGGFDFSFVKGQAAAKRALEIAAGGGHNLLMIGPPGAGKTMLSKCISGILPPMTFEEALETTKIHSIAGELDKSSGIVSHRPFRSPHHTATTPSLIGGGSNSRPGEVSLAHNGVLYLDELPEYPRHVLETLRQPLEDGNITVSRAAQSVSYPSKFMLIASMNPCPCGNFGSDKNPCICTNSQIYKYLGRISGPLLDRIDLHIEVDNVKYSELTGGGESENSLAVAKRVAAARERQQMRYSGSGIYCNSHMQPMDIKQYCRLDEKGEELLKAAFKNLKLSARGYNRILKVARTIADIEGSENISSAHIAEAVQYRALDRKYRVGI